MGWSSLRSDCGVVPCQGHPTCHGHPVCQGNHPPSPLPRAGTTRCWGDPTCWSGHPQSPFSQPRSCWAALCAPNPWHFSSHLEILLFFLIKMYILPIFSFFHPKLATEKPSQGCPSPQPGAASYIPAVPYGASWCGALLAALPTPQSRIFHPSVLLTGIPVPSPWCYSTSHPQDTESPSSLVPAVLAGAASAPRLRAGAYPRGAPQAFRGSGCSRRAAGSFSFAKEPRGESWHGETGKTGVGCVLARA